MLFFYNKFINYTAFKTKSDMDYLDKIADKWFMILLQVWKTLEPAHFWHKLIVKHRSL